MPALPKTRPRRCRPCAVLCSGFSGGLILGLVSVVVTMALWETQRSQLFSTVLGATLLALGVVVIVRAFMFSRKGECMAMTLVLLFTSMVILAGVACIAEDLSTIHKMPKSSKVGIFVLVGLSLSFVLTLAIVDIINSVITACHKPKNITHTARLFVSSRPQIVMTIIAAVLLGAYYGYAFGSAGKGSKQSKGSLSDEGLFGMSTILSAAVAAGAGFVLGALNEWLMRPPADDMMSLYND